MNTLPHQQVCEGHAGGDHTNAHFASSRLRRLFLYGFQDVWPPMTANDDPERFHRSLRNLLA